MRPIRRLALVAAGLLVGTLLAELALRTVYRLPEVADPLYSLFDSDPVLGWRGTGNAHMRFRRPDFDAVIEHDADGWRRPDPPPPPRPARRILFLGDSFTWGWGVAQGEVFSDHLQRQLPAGVAVYNRGVNGYGTGQEYLLLQRELAARPYDVVVLLFFGNDVADNVKPKHGRRPLFELDGERLVAPRQTPQPLMSPLRRFVKDHSRAYQLVDVIVDRVGRWVRDEDGAMPPDPEPTRIDAVAGGPLTMRLLVEMQRLSADHHARFVLVYVPHASEIEPDGPVDPALRVVHASIRALAAQHDIALVDLTEVFAARAPSGPALIFPHDEHWTAAGHALAAQTLLASSVLDLP